MEIFDISEILNIQILSLTQERNAALPQRMDTLGIFMINAKR